MRFWLIAPPFRSFCARIFTAALAVALLLVTLCQSQADDVTPKRVLMLHSFGLRFKPWTDYAEGIRAEISRNSKVPVEYLDHSLLSARLGADQSDTPFVDYLDAVHSKLPPISLLLSARLPEASPSNIASVFSPKAYALYGYRGAQGPARQAY